MTQKSCELFIEEMDAAGEDQGILVGRQAGHRTILNDDIAELRDRYPDRFPVALAGALPSSGGSSTTPALFQTLDSRICLDKSFTLLN